MKINIFFFIFVYFSLFINTAKAINILDYEIELFINDIIELVSSVNNYEKKIPFTIILDDSPNAFINEKNKLFISTGLIKYSDSYEAIVGVLAHELGHLDKFHVSKRKKSIKKLDKINKLTTFTLIAGSLISNNNDYLVKSLVGKKAGINNYYLSFSREQEREADYYGVETLEKLNLSKIPFIKFLKVIENDAIKKGFKREYSKFSTHPLFEERYSIIENSYKNEDLNFDKNLNESFNYIKAKLFGFTERDLITLRQHLKDNYLNYASSIILSKRGKLKLSMKKLNQLIFLNNSNYFFLLETKADILYSNGYLSESMLFYEKVISKYPNNFYIKKKIFDIKFTKNKIKNVKNSNELFNEYSFLLNIFINDSNLNTKFNNLAVISKKTEWIDYFFLDKKLLNNHKKEEYIENINFLKEKTSDIILINLINKKINVLNEK